MSRKWFPCLQAEEQALLIQQFVAAEDNGQIEGRLRPYVNQVRLVIYIYIFGIPFL